MTSAELKAPAIAVVVGLLAYHHGWLNFLFGEPSKAGVKPVEVVSTSAPLAGDAASAAPSGAAATDSLANPAKTAIADSGQTAIG